MRLQDNFTQLEVFNLLKSKTLLTQQEVIILARYPYISLINMCGDLSKEEFKRIKEIEDLNIFYLINSLKIVCGLGSSQENQAFQKALFQEPLRTAIILGQLENNPTDKLITFMCNAIRIILSPKDGGNQFCNNPINVGIIGSMPRDFLKSRQSIANIWFNNFIDIKLDLLSHICRTYEKSDIFRIMMYSISYSLLKYTPNRYNISKYKTEGANLKIIINKFLDCINYYKN